MIQILLPLLFILSTVFAFDINSKTNVAVYWGQNSAGSQKSLASYCQNTEADIFLLSFMNSFPAIGLNFADACTTTFPDGLLQCSQIAEDIKTCQSLGKKVLLSMGGASGAYGFADDAQAEAFATTLWNTFGEGSDISVERPFGQSIVDGFDFDIENNNGKGYAALVSKLRQLFSNGSKQYYISAAPQCPYPDASVGDLLANADVDFAFIQFYNNYCNVEAQFNWDDWKNFAINTSPNKNIKLYLGLPGAPSAAGSGYISNLDNLSKVIKEISSLANFGGISLWDASQATSNVIDGADYLSQMKNILKSAAGSTETPTTSSSYSMPSNLITNTGEQSSSVLVSSVERTTTTLEPTSIISSSSFSDSAPTPTNSHITTTLQPNTNTPPAAAQDSSANVQVSVTPSTTTTTPDSPSNHLNDVSPTPSTPAPSSPANPSPDTPAHTIAKQLNAQYAAGQFNVKSSCQDGELSCSADGKFAMCAHGSWVEMACAAGTTCYAYDSGNSVFTQCNYVDLKASFV